MVCPCPAQCTLVLLYLPYWPSVVLFSVPLCTHLLPLVLIHFRCLLLLISCEYAKRRTIIEYYSNERVRSVCVYLPAGSSLLIFLAGLMISSLSFSSPDSELEWSDSLSDDTCSYCNNLSSKKLFTCKSGQTNKHKHKQCTFSPSVI